MVDLDKISKIIGNKSTWLDFELTKKFDSILNFCQHLKIC